MQNRLSSLPSYHPKSIAAIYTVVNCLIFTTQASSCSGKCPIVNCVHANSLKANNWFFSPMNEQHHPLVTTNHYPVSRTCKATSKHFQLAVSQSTLCKSIFGRIVQLKHHCEPDTCVCPKFPKVNFCLSVKRWWWWIPNYGRVTVWLLYFAIHQIQSHHCMITVYVFRVPRNTVQV